MSKLQEIEDQLASLSAAEKAQLLQLVARDLDDAFPGIESDPDVCGGDACIIRTRVPVWLLEGLRRQCLGEADMLRSYPTLRAQERAEPTRRN